MARYVALLIGDRRGSLDEGIARVNKGLDLLRKEAREDSVGDPKFVVYDRKDIIFSVVYDAKAPIEVERLLREQETKPKGTTPMEKPKPLPQSTVVKGDEKAKKKQSAPKEEPEGSDEKVLGELEKEG